MPQLDLSKLDMIEFNYPIGEDFEDVFIPTKSYKVTSMSALFADDLLVAEGQVKREEVSGQTHQILGKALTSLGTESGYETEGGHEDSENWQSKAVEMWTNDDVMDWIYYQASLCIRDLSTVRGENFQQINGQKICEMSEEDFVARDAANGRTLFRCLQDYKTQSFPTLNWRRKNPLDWSCGDVLDWIYYGSGLSEMNLVCLKGETFQGIDGHVLCSMSSAEFERRDHDLGVMLFSALHSFLDSLMETNGRTSHAINLQEKLPSSTSPIPCAPDQGHRVNGKSLSSSSNTILAPSSSSNLPCDNGELTRNKVKPSRPNATRPKPKRPRKRPIVSSEDVSDDETGSPSKIPKQSSKTRLWKFMRDLLDNPEYNPECIRWENKDEGIFRIVAGRSKVIADLWGKIKNNPTMTFDKLGRSLRWCRANNGKFSAVPRDGKFPRKLCFRLVEPDIAEQPPQQRTGNVPGKVEWNPLSNISSHVQTTEKQFPTFFS